MIMFYKALRQLIIACILICMHSFLNAQTDSIPVRNDQVTKPATEITHDVDIGIGFGLDYGGIFGVQAQFIPVKHLSIFGAIGYYIEGAGWQIGVKGLCVPKTTEKGFRPFFKLMYGTNSQIVVDGAEYYNKIYNGWTVGFGLEFRGKKRQNGIDIDLNVPLRTGQFWDDYNTVQNDPYIEMTGTLLPFTVSIGFHHEF
jgi:hypothetical protein